MLKLFSIKVDGDSYHKTSYVQVIVIRVSVNDDRIFGNTYNKVPFH